MTAGRPEQLMTIAARRLLEDGTRWSSPASASPLVAACSPSSARAAADDGHRGRHHRRRRCVPGGCRSRPTRCARGQRATCCRASPTVPVRPARLPRLRLHRRRADRPVRQHQHQRHRRRLLEAEGPAARHRRRQRHRLAAAARSSSSRATRSGASSSAWTSSPARGYLAGPESAQARGPARGAGRRRHRPGPARASTPRRGRMRLDAPAARRHRGGRPRQHGLRAARRPGGVRAGPPAATDLAILRELDAGAAAGGPGCSTSAAIAPRRTED